jgi:hypothetical protein
LSPRLLPSLAEGEAGGAAQQGSEHPCDDGPWPTVPLRALVTARRAALSGEWQSGTQRQEDQERCRQPRAGESARGERKHV